MTPYLKYKTITLLACLAICACSTMQPLHNLHQSNQIYFVSVYADDDGYRYLASMDYIIDEQMYSIELIVKYHVFENMKYLHGIEYRRHSESTTVSSEKEVHDIVDLLNSAKESKALYYYSRAWEIFREQLENVMDKCLDEDLLKMKKDIARTNRIEQTLNIRLEYADNILGSMHQIFDPFPGHGPTWQESILDAMISMLKEYNIRFALKSGHEWTHKEKIMLISRYKKGTDILTLALKHRRMPGEVSEFLASKGLENKREVSPFVNPFADQE
jgi:hypothetical protein